MPSSSAPLIDPISGQEIEWACKVMKLPKNAFFGDGTDPRIDAIQSLATLDVEACPGSGKTTLLVAKLAILANRWRLKGQGICVLSHTNAARVEIGDRLNSTSAGYLLLRHPHFVGTIHSFVNEFLAIPWLRSKGWPIKIIDTKIALNNRWWRLPSGTRYYLQQRNSGPSLLEYSRLDFSSNDIDAYPPGARTHEGLVQSCRDSTAEGYYCFDEMFVWATELLERCPEVIKTVRARFPFVFIDEVQDNSELQSAFLHRLFMDADGTVVRQRFGDSNQAIYHRTGASGAVTDAFPGAVKVDLPNSFRFGQVVADLAAPLGVYPQALVGRGPTKNRVEYQSAQSVLFLFDDASVLGVLPAYAQHLIETFPPEVLAKGDFTAVAGVHKADKNDHLPRFMGHYAPAYVPNIAGRQPKPDSLAQFLAYGRLELAKTRNTHPIVNCCAEGVLQLLRLEGMDLPFSFRKSAHRYLLELLEDKEARRDYLALLQCLISARCDPAQDGWAAEVATRAAIVAEAITGQEITDGPALDFLVWSDAGASAESAGQARRPTNLFHYPEDDPKVSIRLGSIHGVKGETHTATLVLESFQRAHHLKTLIPWLTGKRPRSGLNNANEDPALRERLKLHYVAMTRPSHLLCLAMRRDALSDKQLDQIKGRNWHIIECAAQEANAMAVSE